MDKWNLRTWLTKGTYPRLYIPVLLIILAVSLLRYHYLITAEVEEAQERVGTEVSRLQHFLLPALSRATGGDDADAVQGLLDAEISFNPDIEALTWDSGAQHATAVQRAKIALDVPAWFVPLVHTERLEKQFSRTMGDGHIDRLVVVIRPDASVLPVWHTVATQMRISALNIFAVLFVLTLLLRANSRMLSRLTLATANFQSGRLDTRMAVRGTLESRAVASAFNAMATQIEQLVTSLQETQTEQTEQLHFTRQLVDALPLPIFVRSARGVCLAVNAAWEKLFDVPANAVVGQAMPSNFSDLHDEVAKHPAATESKDLTASREAVYLVETHGEPRYMCYLKAAFTNVHGIELGDIATLVDVTERKQAHEALLAEKERFEITLASIGDGVITTDVNGRVDFINEAAQLLTGHTARQALGCRLADVFEFDVASQVLTHRSGRRCSLESTSALIRKSDGDAVGTVLVFRDVTQARNLAHSGSWQERHDD